MKKCVLFILSWVFCLSVMAQQPIVLRAVDKAECVKSDMMNLKASFSFSTIEAQDYESERGTFSWLSMPNTVIGGNVGDPQIPVVNQLIAVPFGANPSIEITSYSTTDYRLEDFGIHTLVPHQPSVRKDKRPEEVPFVMNDAAYQVRGLRSVPQAIVSVEGTMRGVQLGTMTIEPVSYDPVNNTIRVFNDIEVTVHFDGADIQTTEDMLLKTYSPAFEPVYAQLFNGRAITDVYTDHPDLYNTPVRMLVICYSGFQGNSALNSWLEWKLQKGYYVDIFYTNETGTTANSIKNFIKTKYNASVSAGNAYTYLIVIGDTGQVPQYMTKTIDNSIGECASDLGYSSVNFTTSNTTNYFPDMYYSRISVENTTHLVNYINKVLTYEKFEFADGGNYLNNVILVGGWDSNWTSRVAKPTINYATNNYFNSSNTTYGGFSDGTIHATISTSSTQGWSGTNHGCYNGLNDGVCFLNYTAHGDKQEWQGPQFTAKQVEGVTNTGKYFFGVGNCCLTGNYNLNNANYSSSYAPSSSIGATACFGETMIRVPNAGAIAYVGCSPYSYWYEDFYWAVGAHSFSAGNAPSVSGSTKGVYDVMFADQYWNSASALLYLGNLAVQQAVTNNNTNSGISGSGEGGDCNNSAHYYFQFYHTFGDGSIMPYITKPETNTVTIPDFVTPGTTSITVNALAGSYVAVTDNSSIIYGVAEANEQGVATVNFTEAIPGTGTLHVVVTRQQYQPYFGTIQIVGGTQYNIYVTQPQHGTISAPTQAYANTTVTLEATPETGYCLSSWTVKKGNTNIPVTNNQFTMPEGDVTVTATFVQGLAITLASMTHGSISADPLYALQGMTINLTATPAEGYEFDSWVVYKTGDSSTTVTVNGDSFTMPNYPVTVSANFVLGPTELTVYDGTATNEFIPMYGYYFDDYTKSECIIPASQLTAMNGCTISAITFYPSSVGTRSWGDSQQTIFLKEVSSTTLGGNYSGTSGATTVKVGSPLEMPTAGTAYTITFDTPYTYNGGNLLIGVYNDDGDYNKVEWYGTSNLTSGVSAYGYNANSLSSVSYGAQKFLPKTTFTYIPIPNEPVTITVSANPMEGGSVTGAGTYDPGTTATLTATANEGYTFTNWTKNGVVMSTNATYSFTVSSAASYVANFTLNSYTITAIANLSEGGTVTVGSSKGNRDDLYYDFEDGWQGWTILQGSTSTSPNNWHHNTTHVSYSSGTAHDWSSFGNNSSSGFMMSESFISATSSSGSAYGAVTPDNYLVSPQVRLGGSISFYAGARNSDYCAEKFSVMVSTTDNTNTASFTTVETWILSLSSAGYTSEPYTVDLSAYAGQTGYIAIRHWDCYDQWVLCIDDITIVEGPDGSTSSGNFNYGETCVVTATPQGAYHFVNWTENGTVVSSEASYSFTVTGDRDLVANFNNAFTLEIDPYNDDSDGWYLIASPIASAVAPTAVTNMLSNTYDLYYFDQNQEKEWVNYKPCDGNVHPNFDLVPGKGYLYANSSQVDLVFTGMPTTETTITVALDYEDNARLKGYNLVGNPFAQTAYIDHDFYRMNDNHDDFISNIEDEYNVNIMESVIVIAADANDDQVTFTTDPASAKSNTTQSIVLNVVGNNGDIIDRAMIRFNKNRQLPKYMLNSAHTNISIPQDNKEYAIVKAEMQGETPVNFKAGKNGSYTLYVNTQNVEMGYLHLIDNMTGADVDLLASESVEGPASYTFNAKVNDYESRFRLVFSASNTGNETESDNFAFFSNGNIIINGTGTLQVIDAMGRIVYCKDTAHHISTTGMAQGVYVLRLIDGDKVRTQKVVIK